jgi:uncharacterized protein YdeI (YjbR/CyaY-like superfamily)
MSEKTIKLLEVHERSDWRRWLARRHKSESEVWLVFWKDARSMRSLQYEDAVEEALCFGWIDSIVRRLDSERYARKFTPRNAHSRWSTINRKRYEKLSSLGLLASQGEKLSPTNRSGDAPRPSLSSIPAYIAERLATNSSALHNFERLAPSYRLLYIGWIESAKRDETKQRRLQEAIGLLASGKKLGLK